MKRFKYYQPNKKDLADECNDCAIRAFSKFFDLTWIEAFDALCVYARQRQMMPNDLRILQLAMEAHNKPYTSVYKPKDKRKLTVLDFSKAFIEGKYILYIKAGYGTHLVCVENGIYYDTWDCGEKIVYGYWKY